MKSLLTQLSFQVRSSCLLAFFKRRVTTNLWLRSLTPADLLQNSINFVPPALTGAMSNAEQSTREHVIVSLQILPFRACEIDQRMVHRKFIPMEYKTDLPSIESNPMENALWKLNVEKPCYRNSRKGWALTFRDLPELHFFRMRATLLEIWASRSRNELGRAQPWVHGKLFGTYLTFSGWRP